MGTRKGNKLPSDFVAADHSISLDSLSFSGLVSIQHQPLSPPLNQPKRHDQTTIHQSPEFEFDITKPTASNSAANSIKTTPSDLLISIGHLQPHALAFQSDHQPGIANPPHSSSLRSLHAAYSSGHGDRLSSSSGYTSKTMKFHGVESGRKPRSKSFGRKVLESFVSPCRECQAIKPGAV